MRYWLLKTEPDTFSIDDLSKRKTEPWTGVRNYQARNNMLAMEKGDKCFFYHSSCEVPGVVGVCVVNKINIVDETQFDAKSEYFDAKSKKENPTWKCVEVKFEKKFERNVTLSELRDNKKLKNMKLLQKGSRLSVQPVTKEEFEYISKLATL
jgi:predicted RNA-binding protein with PUA-like domain